MSDVGPVTMTQATVDDTAAKQKVAKDAEPELLLTDMRIQTSRRRHSAIAIGPMKEDDIDSTSIFPMYVIPFAVFQGMSKLQSFKELMAAQSLVKFCPGMVVAYVTHEWCGTQHPDPEGRQLQIMQSALENLASGKAQIMNDSLESRAYTQQDLKELTSIHSSDDGPYIWIDFSCLPQSEITASEAARKASHQEHDPKPESEVPSDDNEDDEDDEEEEDWKVLCKRPLGSYEVARSLVTYIDECEYFFILAPCIPYAEHTDKMMNYDTYRSHGWARLECTARALSGIDSRMLLVQDESTILALQSQNFALEPPCAGSFANEGDRAQIAKTFRAVFKQKREECMEIGALGDFRMLQATENLLLRGPEDVPADEPEDSDSGLEDSDSDYENEDDATELRKGQMEVEQKRAEEQVANVVKNKSARTARSYRSDKELVWDFLRLYGLVSPQRPDETQRTALHYAAAAGQERVIRTLVALGSPINGLPDCSEGLVDEELLEAAEAKWSTCPGMTPLHYAARFNHGKPSAIKALLSLGATVDSVDICGRTALMICAVSGNLSAARLLIQGGSRLDHADGHGRTALHLAVASGRLEIVKLLVGSGATVDSALPVKTSSNSEEAATPAGEDLPEVSLSSHITSSTTALHQIINSLGRHHQGMTPLMAAALMGNKQIEQVLVSAGADTTRRNSLGFTSSDLAQLNEPSNLKE
eukprot:TRINITY_DN21317_c0_g1_i1.p1 TRINITY_DN21317_c0_g1~~TRINITY_DN21317_c0_g1_i1.p1  ORF type:complete len:715 (+),score=178.30 TRINITY_DN21317_c0_g1_i1:38-2146(+)